ncbi:AT-rich interactive domain-containing protein 2-like [Durio zibethinus]|uniref:AT-rich interactive domain-containing protein 2-like n=1 Tax=Durio zibethinus TaxID=66656 RepID=A0A6P5YCM6_DURZI|nr:AT-rich interactive domain-containing protein 2-like [Durio zibethinus]
MAGWSILTNGSALDSVGLVNKCQSNGCHLDVGPVAGDSVEKFGDYKDRLRCLFDLVLSGYLKEVAGKGFVRPIPAMLGNDGQSPDLLKLFLVVREIGGYEFVSKKGLWASVVKELGLDLDVSASVKLIYAKYLHELEKWLRNGFGDRHGEGKCGGNFGFLSLEQEEEFRGLFTNGVDQKVVVNRVALSEYIKHDKFIGKDTHNGLKISDANDRCRLHNGVEKLFGDDDEKLCRNDLLVLDSPVARKEYSTRKRKRKSLLGMLNWVIQVAKCPDDPSVGAILDPSKWKDHGGNEFWIQAIRAREALRQKRDDHSNIEKAFFQNNQKMHPSMYEDDFLSHPFTHRLRCNERLPTSKSCSCSCCCAGSALENNLMCLHKAQSEYGPNEQSLVAVGLSSLDMSTTAGPSGDDSFRRQVSVGPLYQAEVPEWTGMVSDTDSKWLGTREWPLKGREHDSLAVTDPIGRGRPYSCGCQIPGSVECIRLHTAEKRMKLKLELGSVFYRWRFDGMGEEVSLRWTAEEEKRFKYMVQLEPPSLNEFWPNAFKFFPWKTRRDLVSYYFNVFLIRRRSYQNRVTPKSIDSDDDESEFGCISDSFGSDALKIPGSNMLTCSQNNQCIDWESDEY